MSNVCSIPEKFPPLDSAFVKEVERLCSSVRGHAPCEGHCLGSLDCVNGGWNLMRRESIPPVIPYSMSTVSLEALLERKMLQEVTRLELGVQLASAVLQLHSTYVYLDAIVAKLIPPGNG